MFVEGFTRLGFAISKDIRHRPSPGDVFLTWNRMPGLGDDQIARRWRADGGTVLVTENGWIGPHGENDKLFALCRDHHNGLGWWPEKDAVLTDVNTRWDRLGIPLKPWRTTGHHILLLGQRGFGPPEVAQPPDWIHRMGESLKAATRRPIVIRAHPGRHKDRAKPLAADLANCWAVVTWASGAAIKAIAAGIPVFYGLKDWIGAPAAVHIKTSLCVESPFLGDRLPMFRRLAWAQWTAAEIATGEPLRRLLQS